jgi:hypothetical protein
MQAYFDPSRRNITTSPLKKNEIKKYENQDRIWGALKYKFYATHKHLAQS